MHPGHDAADLEGERNFIARDEGASDRHLFAGTDFADRGYRYRHRWDAQLGGWRVGGTAGGQQGQHGSAQGPFQRRGQSHGGDRSGVRGWGQRRCLGSAERSIGERTHGGGPLQFDHAHGDRVVSDHLVERGIGVGGTRAQ